MKKLLLCLGATLFLAASLPASADPFGRGRGGAFGFQVERGGRDFGQRRDYEPPRREYELPRREYEAPRRDWGGRRDWADPGRGEGPRRLSPEERRQLRRDVDDAGRDIYQRRWRRQD